MALLCLMYLDVEAVLLGRSLLFFNIVKAALRRILHLLLLHLSFVVDALLVSTLLSPARRVWGRHLMALKHPVFKHVVEL